MVVATDSRFLLGVLEKQLVNRLEAHNHPVFIHLDKTP